jgi:GINS complex subunit 1
MALEESGSILIDDIRSRKLKPYRHNEVRGMASESASLDAAMEEIRLEASSEISEELSVNYIMLKHHKDRNDRIVRAYHFHRLSFIHSSFLHKSSMAHLLSAEEEEYMREYGSAIGEYMGSFDVLDFGVTEPPIHFFVQVVTLGDCGVIMDEESFMELKKDRIYFVRKSAISHLISSGLVRIIEK